MVKDITLNDRNVFERNPDPSTGSDLLDQLTDQIKEQAQLNQAQTEDREQKDTTFKGGRFEADINKISAEDSFIINDIKLAIPPTSIQINKRNIHYKWHTLRSNHPAKVKTGFGEIQVTLSIYFVGSKAINEGLRRLAIELEHSPFAYVENQYLRDNIAPGSYGNMAFTILDFTIRTEPGLTDTLILDLDMTYFNYKPFSKDFTYRETWRKRDTENDWKWVDDRWELISNSPEFMMSHADPNREMAKYVAVEQYNNTLHDLEEATDGRISQVKRRNLLLEPCVPVKSPKESLPYVTFYDNLQKNRALISPEDTNKDLASGNKTTLQQELTFRYYEFKQVHLPKDLEFLANRKMNAGAVPKVDTSNMEIQGSTLMLMRPEAKADLEELATKFRHDIGRPLPIKSCFRTYVEQAALYNSETYKDLANKPGTSWHEAGLAVDIALGTFTEDEYVWLVKNATQLTNGGFLVNHTIRNTSLNKSKVFNEESLKQAQRNQTPERWHFTHASAFKKSTTVQSVLKEIYPHDTGVIEERLLAVKTTFKKWLETELKGGWIQEPFFPRIFKRKQEFSLSGSNELPSPPGNKLIMTSMAISMNNMVARIPLLSHQYATHQYLGSTDKDIHISLIAHGLRQLKELQLMNNVLEENSRLFRKVPESGLVQLSANNILSFMNINKVIIESINTKTMPGTPDAFAVDLIMTQWNHKDEQILIEFVTDTGLREKVIKRLVSQIVKDIKYAGKVIDGRRVYPKTGKVSYLKLERTVGRGKIKPSRTQDDYLFGKNGLLDKLIDIVEELNSELYSEEVAQDLSIPYNYPMYLFGAETLVHPGINRAGSEDISTTDPNVPAPVALNPPPDPDRVKRADKNQRSAIETARDAIKELADSILSTYFLEDDKLFSDIFQEAKLRGSIANGSPGYPDLNLPSHPVTNRILDTDPDWFFYNQSEEGKEGYLKEDEVIKGNNFVNKSYGSYSKLNNGDWYSNYYISPNFSKPGKDDIDYMKADGYFGEDSNEKDNRLVITSSIKLTGDYVNRLGDIGVLGSRYLPGKDNVRYKSKKNTKDTMFGSQAEGRSSLHDFGNTDEGLAKTYKMATASINIDQHTMRRAFPTFKLYFIENESIAGNSNESNKCIRGFDDFYSYSAIKDMRIIRSRKIPADLAVITMTNIAGLLDGRAFYSGKAIRKEEEGKAGPFNPDLAARRSLENPWEGIILKEGQKVQIRLGYSNNPNELETVFNGQIVEVGPSESGDLIQIVCQSYGVELVQQIKGLDVQPEDLGGARKVGDTQALLSTLICEPELVHFGRWVPNPNYNPAEIQVGSTTDSLDIARRFADVAREAITQKWQRYNAPADDNIFAPADNDAWEKWKRLLRLKRLDYYIVHTTIWDIFKEMELRHPGWIASPIPYEDRYTMFFGVPAQHYWSRPASIEEIKGLHELNKQRQKQIDQLTRNAIIDSLDGFPSAVFQGDTSLVNRDKYLLEAIRLATDRFIPFRKYHMLTSEHNIVSNNIVTDVKNSINAVSVEYRKAFDDVSSVHDFTENSKTLTVKADDNIEDNNTRLLHEAYINCEGRYMARNYALGLLLRHLKDIYTGEICILGDARIKPHDICYIMDSYSDMFGSVGVEQVTHILSFDDGFITKIVPDLVVTANEWYNMPITDAIQSILTPIYHKITGGDNISTGAAVGVGAGALALGGAALYAFPVTFTLGSVIAMLGGLKFFNWTQERQPVCITPLLHHGIPYIAGLQDFKHQNVWSYINGELVDWVTGKEDGTLEDFQDKLSMEYSTFKNNWKINIFNAIQGLVGK